MDKRRPLVAGNWKMNGSLALVDSFINIAGLSDSVDTVICPPAIYLQNFRDKGFSVGAQDVSHLDSGAHTGDISTDMLKDVGCRFVIVGHSERREDHHESSTRVAEKSLKVINAGLIPIICVGEPLLVREARQEKEYVTRQLAAVFDVMSVDKLENAVIAYEPIWAIGTGKTATPLQAQEMHEFIRDFVGRKDKRLAGKMRILYGGSVKPSNAAELFRQSDIDGGLIGGASLNVKDFIAICQAAI